MSASTISVSIVILGAGGHARVVADVARLCGWQIAGFLDDITPERKGEPFFGAHILGGRDQLPRLKTEGISAAFVAFGNCKARLKAIDFMVAQGFSIPTLIHPRAIIAGDVKLGEGSFVAAGAVVNPAVSAGRGVIVNTSSSVDHDCFLSDAVHICPGVHLGGGVQIGAATWIGIGSTVREGIKIGAGSVIGAGAVVVRDLPDSVVAVGVPAKVTRAISDATS